jgi:hypothetical protein
MASRVASHRHAEPHGGAGSHLGPSPRDLVVSRAFRFTTCSLIRGQSTRIASSMNEVSNAPFGMKCAYRCKVNAMEV